MVYILNGVDLEATFGVVIKNVVNALMALPDRKPSLSHDFPDENGLDVDLSNPTFVARDFTFNCVLTADTVENLKNQYFAFFTLLKQQGSYQLYNDFLDMTIDIYYQKQANLSGIQAITNNGYAVTFDLNFSETDSDLNIPIIYLVDEQNRFLVP